MKVLSLFNGYSGTRLALNKLGIYDFEYHSSEIDKYAIQVAQENNPDTIQIGDVRNVSGHDYKGVDLCTAGFSCQSWSVAGRRKGIDDPRGQLALETLRIWEECQPKYFLFENVASMSKVHRKFLDDLFGVKSIKVNSSLVSAQHRERIYWSNIPFDLPKDRGIILERDGVPVHAWSKSPRERDEEGFRLYDERVRANGKAATLTCVGPKGQDSVSFFPNDPLAYFPPRKNILRKDLYLQSIPFESRITEEESEVLQGVPVGHTKSVSSTQRYKLLGNGFQVDTIAHILQGSDLTNNCL